MYEKKHIILAMTSTVYAANMTPDFMSVFNSLKEGPSNSTGRVADTALYLANGQKAQIGPFLSQGQLTLPKSSTIKQKVKTRLFFHEYPNIAIQESCSLIQGVISCDGNQYSPADYEARWQKLRKPYRDQRASLLAQVDAIKQQLKGSADHVYDLDLDQLNTLVDHPLIDIIDIHRERKSLYMPGEVDPNKSSPWSTEKDRLGFSQYPNANGSQVGVYYTEGGGDVNPSYFS
jgi:hypothetical protein